MPHIPQLLLDLGGSKTPGPEKGRNGEDVIRSMLKKLSKTMEGIIELAMTTLQGINLSHLGKRKIIFKMPFLGDMLVPWRVYTREHQPICCCLFFATPVRQVRQNLQDPQAFYTNSCRDAILGWQVHSAVEPF